LSDYLKLDHTSIASSRLTGTVPNDLSYDYLLQKATLGHLNFIISLS